MIPRTIFICLFALAGCSRSEPAKQPDKPDKTAPAATTTAAPARDPATARKLIADGAVVLDVRTAEEFAGDHVPSAKNIPVDEVGKRLAEIDQLVAGDKSRPVVVYCGSGSRSARAKRELESSGYSHVVNGGGLDDLVP